MYAVYKIEDLANVIENNTSVKITLRGQDWISILCDKLPQSNLTSLDLSDNNIRGEGVKAIAGVLPQSNLTSLDLSWNKSGDEGVKAIAGVLPQSNLTSLDLSDNNIGDEGVKAIAGVLPYCSLTKLSLSWNNIGDKGTEALINSLHSNVYLEELIGIYNSELQQLLTPEVRQARFNRLRNTKSARNRI